MSPIKFHGNPYSRRSTDSCEQTDGYEANWPFWEQYQGA